MKKSLKLALFKETIVRLQDDSVSRIQGGVTAGCLELTGGESHCRNFCPIAV